MNTREEIQQAFADYRRTRFGGWPWKRSDPVHEREKGRFAVHADGYEEKPKPRRGERSTVRGQPRWAELARRALQEVTAYVLTPDPTPR